MQTKIMFSTIAILVIALFTTTVAVGLTVQSAAGFGNDFCASKSGACINSTDRSSASTHHTQASLTPACPSSSI